MCRIRSHSKSVWSTDDEVTRLTVLQVKDVKQETQNRSFFKYGAGTPGARPTILSSCDESKWKKVKSIGRTKRQTFRPGYPRTSCVKTLPKWKKTAPVRQTAPWEAAENSSCYPKPAIFQDSTKLWHCPANSACKHFADLTLTSEIWFHLWNFRYVDLEGWAFDWNFRM